jgi:hypothetical protein
MRESLSSLSSMHSATNQEQLAHTGPVSRVSIWLIARSQNLTPVSRSRRCANSDNDVAIEQLNSAGVISIMICGEI